jgi:hypothetical protein
MKRIKIGECLRGSWKKGKVNQPKRNRSTKGAVQAIKCFARGAKLLITI